MPTFLLPRPELTPDQLRVVELPPSEHRIVFGSPGSGKTQILIHRAAHLRDNYRVDPDRFRILVFTNVLTDYIRSALEFVEIPQECVMTFDRLCVEFYLRHISSRLPWNAESKSPDFTAVHQAVVKLAKTHAGVRNLFDFILVDEGQDLTLESFEILRCLSKHVTVFADHQQQIFEQGASEEEILRALGLNRRNATLLAAYRNSPDVARLASCFIADTEARGNYLKQIKNHQSVRERPLCFVASNYDEEMEQLAKVVKQRLLMNQRVGIIVPQLKHVHGFAAGLAERGCPLKKHLEGKAGERAPGNKLTLTTLRRRLPHITVRRGSPLIASSCRDLPKTHFHVPMVQFVSASCS
jgi:superfamily I DNA/RNA helicase